MGEGPDRPGRSHHYDECWYPATGRDVQLTPASDYYASQPLPSGYGAEACAANFGRHRSSSGVNRLLIEGAPPCVISQPHSEQIRDAAILADSVICAADALAPGVRLYCLALFGSTLRELQGSEPLPSTYYQCTHYIGSLLPKIPVTDEIVYQREPRWLM